MDTKTIIELQATGFSIFSKGEGKLIFEDENGKLELDILDIKSQEYDSYNSLYYKIFLSQENAIKFFSKLITKEHKQNTIYRRNEVAIQILELHPEMKLEAEFQLQDKRRDGGIVFPSGLQFKIIFGSFWRAEWENNIAILQVFHKLVAIIRKILPPWVFLHTFYYQFFRMFYRLFICSECF